MDAHQHFWEYDSLEYSWINDKMNLLRQDYLPEKLAPILDENQIAGCVAVQARQHEQETTFLLHLAHNNDFIRGVVGWVDLCSHELEQRLAYFQQFPKLRGFRHVLQDEPNPQFMLSKEFLKGIASLEKYGFTYDLLIYHHQLENAVELVKKFPRQQFVIDHIAKPDISQQNIDTWKNQIREIANIENTWCKISGMVTEAGWSDWKYEDLLPYLEVVFEAFGTDRCMFGSDWPVCLLAAEYSEVLGVVEQFTKGFPEGDKNKLWCDNAMEFYNLIM